MTLVKENYIDFGPTFAAEKLAEDHGLKVSRETLRKLMQDAGIWLSRKQRRTFHQPRLRRECYGELIQIDGSDHRWFEDRGPACTLLVFIDDATSTLLQPFFYRRYPANSGANPPAVSPRVSGGISFRTEGHFVSDDPSEKFFAMITTGWRRRESETKRNAKKQPRRSWEVRRMTPTSPPRREGPVIFEPRGLICEMRTHDNTPPARPAVLRRGLICEMRTHDNFVDVIQPHRVRGLICEMRTHDNSMVEL